MTKYIDTKRTTKKGLLTKSFFSLGLALCVAQAQARTLIFQSEDQSAATPEPQVQTLAAPSAGAAPQSSSTQNSNAQSQTNQMNTEMFLMMQQLQKEVSQLRGLVEEQGFQLRKLQKSSKERYKDLDRRVLDLSGKIESFGSGAPSAAATNNAAGASVNAASSTGAAVPNVAVVPVAAASPENGSKDRPEVRPEDKPVEATQAQKAQYAEAYNHVKNKDFDAAIDALYAYVEKYPEGDLTGNAYYWLGEVYLVVPQLEQAKQAFSIVVQSFPNHRKQADAMFKLAVTYDRLQDPAQAETYLKQVQQTYPNSTASKLAKSYKVNR